MSLQNIKKLEQEEFIKRDSELTFIASENYCSEDVLEACGSIFMQKYSEGFPQKRYYEGCEVVDKMEQECINTVLKLFNAEEEYYAQVQCSSGASANFVVYNAILKPNDVVLAPDTASLGHISHGHPKSFIAKYHQVETYGVDENGLLDYDEIERLAIKYSPKLIIAGASNYPRVILYDRFKQIADKVGAYLMADIAHTSVFHAYGLLQSPVGLADFITSTTHKCMGSARSAFILYKKDFHRAICTSTIPTCFGGQLANMTYAKLVGFRECLSEEKKYIASQTLLNAKTMADTFALNNIPIVTGDTHNHLCTVDLRNFNITGKQLSTLLAKAGFICNANTVPNDTRSFLETSGVRIGTPAVTTRGLRQGDIQQLIQHVCDIINLYANGSTPDNLTLEEKLHALKVGIDYYCKKFPLREMYPKMYNRLFGV